LTGILLYASILKGENRLDPALLPDVERVVSETQRCAGIVRNLLEFSRESVPDKEDVVLDSILDEVVTLFHQQPDFSGIVITRNYGRELPQISVDPGQIRQVLLNLIINAGHAMPQGGDLEITTYRSDDGRYVCAVIKDSGEGIANDNLARIFDPFFTTKAEGTGLGLSISYGIMESHGGRIEVQSKAGEGAAFTVMIPVSC
jgi:two-component system NtrC family sensor kinase